MTDLPKMAHDRCVAQIAESLFGQPGMTLMEMAGRREEIVALAKDAARYRWLRNGEYRPDIPELGGPGYVVIDKYYDEAWLKSGDHLDAAIDAAMENGNV